MYVSVLGIPSNTFNSVAVAVTPKSVNVVALWLTKVKLPAPSVCNIWLAPPSAVGKL